MIDPEKILEALEHGPMRNGEIVMALGIDDPSGMQMTKELRKLAANGRVSYQAGKWHLGSRRPCEHCEGKGWVNS